MKTMRSTEDLEEILRSVLIIQSELNEEQVLNSLSIHGEDLDKLFEEQVYVSIDRTDALLLFELVGRNSTSDVSDEEDDTNDILTYRSFSLRCIIYGNASQDIATKIVSRLRTKFVIEQVQSLGIYLETISDITSVNEYKNETMWQRADFMIDISCQFKIEKISTEYDMTSIDVDKIYQV